MQVDLPLTGVKVLDFTQVIMGPIATQILADYGADVIKIEKPEQGDISRKLSRHDQQGVMGPGFISANRNKRSVVLDLTQAASRERIWQLIERSDVVVSNFRIGTMERLGFGYEAVRLRNPACIYAIGSGFGSRGRFAHKPGVDILAQAASGAVMRRTNSNIPLHAHSSSIADYSAGMHLAQGILLALLQRQKTGEGQRVEVNLLDSMIALQHVEAAAHLTYAQDLNWGDQPLKGVYETLDGALALHGAFKADPFGDLCRALNTDLHLDRRFSNHMVRAANKTALRTALGEIFAANTTDHWLTRLEAEDVMCAPVCTMESALAESAQRDLIMRSGKTAVVGSPVTLSAAPVEMHREPPDLGEHTAEVLAELGPLP
jgi:crotonobetainyl-CoA:carnitine CoA-transferase CaiB-like acyl-CoA transferase